MIAIQDFFSKCAQWTARQMGRATTFALACLVVVVWAATGPIFHYSDTWQLVINTGTTIVTFLMVFLLQHAQNRDATAIQLKLDELIRVSQGARNKLLALEDLTELELEKIRLAFTTIAAKDRGSADLDDTREDLEKAQTKIEDVAEAIDEIKRNGEE